MCCASLSVPAGPRGGCDPTHWNRSGVGFAPQQVGDGLAADQLANVPAPHRDYRRPPDAVVRRGEAVVVGAGAGHGEHVPGTQVDGELDVHGDYVAGLAVPADHGHRGVAPSGCRLAITTL